MFCDPLGVHHLPGRKVRASEVTNFPLPYQVVQRPQRFFHRRIWIWKMQLVKVDPVGLQAAQAGLGRSQDVIPRSALQRSRLIHGAAEFSGQHDFFPPLTEHLPQDRLRPPALPINIGSIKQGDAEINGLVDHLAGFIEVNPHAKVITSQADHRYFHVGVAELPPVHSRTSRKR